MADTASVAVAPAAWGQRLKALAVELAHFTAKEARACVFAGLFFVIVIGLVVENIVFASIERRTVRRWGMQH